MNDYQEQILDHYHNPRNFGKPAWVPTHSKKLQNLACGDEVEVFLLVDSNIIRDASFTGEGCSISIASASLFTEEIKQKSINYLQSFTIENMLEILGIKLTSSRMRCANLIVEASKESLSSTQ